MYPDLVKCQDKSDMPTFKSESDDMLFSMYNGIVFKQSYSFKHEPLNLSSTTIKPLADWESAYNESLESVYYSFANSSQGYKSCNRSQSGKAITYYYPEYSVYIQHVPDDCVSVTYELYPEFYKYNHP